MARSIDSAPAAVWKALTTPTSLKQFFFGAEVESDWQIGNPIHISGELKGKPYEDKGNIIAVDPKKRLSFSHWSPLSGMADTDENYHVVTFELEPHGERTKVTLTQSNLTGGVRDSDVQHKADYEKNWQGVLDGLSKVLTKKK